MAREAGFETTREWALYPDGFVVKVERLFQSAYAAGAAAEREACAKVCEALEEHKGHACAYAIRARGQG
jgi:hypothetical protein